MRQIPIPTEATVSRPVAEGYAWKLEYGTDPTESLYLAPAVGPGREQRIQTVEPPQQGVNTAVSPEELRGETGEVFGRSDFTGGEGLDRAHKPDGENRDKTRFWDSRNIDITPGRAGDPDVIQLLHSAALIRNDDAGNVRMPLVQIGTTLYMVCSDQATVDRTTDLGANFTTENPHAGEGTQDVLDLTTLGDQVYAAITTNDIHVRSAAGTWTHWSDLSATRIWGVKGRIIASTGAALYDAAAAAASVLLHTLPSGETWSDVIDAGGAILAGASDGQIYMFVDEDGTLALRGQFTFPAGERITALGFSQGFVFVGTGAPVTGGSSAGRIGRLWRCQLVGLRFQGNQVVRQWGDGATTLNQAPQKIIATREAVYTAVIDSATESHVWKYHLGTAGISRDLILADGLVYGLAMADDRLFATVMLEGLYREATTYATTGYLISPLADFFTSAAKTWIDARLTTGTLATDTDVVLAYSTNPAAITDSAHASWTTIISADHVTFGDLGPTFISESESRYVAAKLTLTPNGAATATPTVLAFALRGLFKPVERDYAIPVNISDRVEMPGRRPFIRDRRGRELLEALANIEGKAVTLTDLRTGEVVDGQYRGVSIPIQERGSKRGSLPTFGMVTVRGILR